MYNNYVVPMYAERKLLVNAPSYACSRGMKCNMNGIGSIRLYNIAFYHFVSVGTKSEERIQESIYKEQMCHEYFRYKWGGYMKRDYSTNKILVS